MNRVIINLTLIFLSVISAVSNAEVVVRLEVQQGDNVDYVAIKLLENEAPLTVANFLNYVRDGDYIKSFIHRSDPGFIVQGGGFTFDSSINDGSFTYDSINDLYPGGLQLVPDDAPVPNEFGRSNIRGTMAMAKIGAQFEDGVGVPCFPESPTCTLVPGTGPDSASSQWFFNLDDNSSILDAQNGGFTVFAEVLNGMSVVDAIARQATFPRTDIHFAFGELPLLNYIVDPIQEANLVYTSNIEELFTITPNIDYGTVTSGTNLQPEIVIKNISNNILTIGNIADVKQISPPFRIINNGCSNSVLQPGGRCAFIVLFSPESSGAYTDSFNIEFPDLGVSYEVMLNGEGGPLVPEQDITLTSSSVDFGDVDVFYDNNFSYASRQIINNFGDLPLLISGISLQGPDVDEISLSGDCLDVSSLDPNVLCSLVIEFIPLSAGSKSASLTIVSDDPDESPFVVPIFGNAIAEDDGVPATVEDAGPNGGDGNNDGILDSQQGDVASIVSMRGSYVTFITSNGIRMANMSVARQSEYDTLPDSIDLNSGVYSFDAEQFATGVIVDVGLILPEDLAPGAFYIYGPTLDNATPHWYEFNYDGETGAQIIGKATIQSASGNAITRNLVTLRFKDGGRGDSDLKANGNISTAVGVSVIPVTDGGAVNIQFIIMFIVVLLFARSRWHDILMKGLLHHRHIQNNFNS